jgi:hypothetical protein
MPILGMAPVALSIALSAVVPHIRLSVIIRAKQGCRAVPSIGHAAEFFVLRAM